MCIRDSRKGVVGDKIGKPCIKLIGHFRSGHLCSSLGHIDDPLIDLLHLPGLGSADEVVDTAVALYHIGGNASHIPVRVVDPGVGDNVLS